MKSLLNVALMSALLTGASLAQVPNAESPLQNTAVRFSPGTVIRAELEKSVDAKKAKVGDQVLAKTMDDFLSDKNEVLAPKGSQVRGSRRRGFAASGQLAIDVGDCLRQNILKNGTEVPLKASIQAIGPPESNPAAFNDPMAASAAPGAPSMSSPGRGAYGGTAPNPGVPASANPAGTAIPDTTGAAINGRLTPNAQGVVGISGLSLGTGAAQDSLLTSPKHNVKLDSGTQMILHVIP